MIWPTKIGVIAGIITIFLFIFFTPFFKGDSLYSILINEKNRPYVSLKSIDVKGDDDSITLSANIENTGEEIATIKAITYEVLSEDFSDTMDMTHLINPGETINLPFIGIKKEYELKVMDFILRIKYIGDSKEIYCIGYNNNFNGVKREINGIDSFVCDL